MSNSLTAGNRCVCLQTPAKINTYLYLQRKRPDGYHELVMDLIPIALFDQIEIKETQTGGVEFTSNLAGVAQEDNLVVKAIRILEQETKQRFSLTAKLTKNIPTGAGLGGGSGNAAGMMVALNALYDLRLSLVRLRQLALDLGTDVPFFIEPRPSLAEGKGERLTALPDFPSLQLLLLYPGFEISTRHAYANSCVSGRSCPRTGYLLSDFTGLDPGINDFWPSLALEFPQLKYCRQALLEQGAVFAGLSGSGSTVFGVFPTEAACKLAFSKLATESAWKLFPCKTLPAFSYLPLR